MTKFHSSIAAVVLVSALFGGCTSRRTKSANLVKSAGDAVGRGDIGRASRLYRDAIRLDPRNGDAYLGLAEAEAKSGHPDQVAWAAVRAMDLVKESRQTIRCYLLLGDSYLALHPKEPAYLDGVTRMASETVRLDPSSSEAYRQLGEVASIRATASPSDADRWRERAIAEFERAGTLRKDDPRILTGWGAALVAAGQLKEAEPIYARLGALRPADAAPRLALASLALTRKAPDDAQAIFRGIVSQKTADVPRLTEFCREAIRHGWYQDVLPILSYLEQHGGDAVTVSEFYIGSNQPEKAINFLQSRIKGSATSAEYALLGQTLLDQGLAQRALAAAGECLGRFPKSPDCRAVQLYQAARASADPEDAAKLERLEADNPSEPLVHLYIGKLYQQTEHPERTRMEFDQTLRVYPNRLDLRLARAQLEFALHENFPARADAEEVLKRYPANQLALAIVRGTESVN